MICLSAKGCSGWQQPLEVAKCKRGIFGLVLTSLPSATFQGLPQEGYCTFLPLVCFGFGGGVTPIKAQGFNRGVGETGGAEDGTQDSNMQAIAYEPAC